ncbi:MAG: sigma-70 family RNA polymerase sigma factor [Nocardioides sp.]
MDLMARSDDETTEWLRILDSRAEDHESGLSSLHERLLRIARSELRRRGTFPSPELDDLAHQAAADAMLAILAKLATFRGESRFTTWAYRFVVLEVSHKLGRHYWRGPTVSWDDEQWEVLPDRLGVDPHQHAEARGLIKVVRDAVDQTLSEHQRAVFVDIVLHGVPLDAVCDRDHVSRSAVYKTIFDARRKIRAALVANGYLDGDR